MALLRGTGTPWRLRANDLLGRGGARKNYRESRESITRMFWTSTGVRAIVPVPSSAPNPALPTCGHHTSRDRSGPREFEIQFEYGGPSTRTRTVSRSRPLLPSVGVGARAGTGLTAARN